MQKEQKTELTYRQVGRKWLFSDGTVLPVISGGFDIEVPNIGGDPSGGDPTVTNDQPPVGSESSEISEFAQGVLKNIPDQDRAIVQKYMKDWDGNVTKKFQEIHKEYEPYKAYGSVEDLASTQEIISMINDNPMEFYNRMTQALRDSGMLEDDNMSGNEEVSNLPEFEGVPKEFVEKFQQTQEQLNRVMEYIEGDSTAKEQKELLQRFDARVAELHTTHGDFDEDYFITKLSQGYSEEEAIKAWNDTLEKHGSPRKPAPINLPGNGGVPNRNQVVPSKMNKQDRISYGRQLLEQANANN